MNAGAAATKHQIARAIKDIPRERLYIDFQHLCAADTGPTSKAGMDTVDYFTFEERLNTVGYQGLSFYQFLRELPTLQQKPYIKNMVKFYKTHNPQTPPLKMWYRIFSMYFGSINMFKPAVALSLYRRGPAELRILDPTMGWGGRALAAAAAGAVSYTGIDTNQRLQRPLAKMAAFLADVAPRTKITFLFEDSLGVDYSRFSYNFVLTSPPYYNIETYSHMKTYSNKTEWHDLFYRPLFLETMKHLERGGWYCLNIPYEIYAEVCLPLWGVAHHQQPLSLSARTKNSRYKEFVYIWKKTARFV
jgi:hypothetical protein